LQASSAASGGATCKHQVQNFILT